MSRSTTTALRSAVFAEETAEVFLFLITLSHTDITTLYFVNNYEDVTSNGNAHVAFPFQITMPSETEDQLPRVQLNIDNVDRSIIDEIRTLTGPPTLTLSVVLASDPDTIEAGPFEMSLQNVSYNALTITGNLVGDDILNEPYPGEAYTPQNFPGLF